MPPNLRVLHCPLNNANNPWVLSRAERKLGLQSDLVVFQSHPFYGQNFDLNLEINFPSLPNEIKRIEFLRSALKKYDVFHFNFGQSIWDHPFPGFNFLDFPILKRWGKKIIVTFQGDDIRQKDYFLKEFGPGHYGSRKYSFTDGFFDANKRRRIKKVTQYADAIFALNPDLLKILPPKAEFLPYCNPAWGVHTSRKPSSGKLTIIHAPSDREIKGTEEIIYTIKKLAARYRLRLLLVEATTHQDTLRLSSQADIAVDQIRLGWYGGFAVEMMAQGVPVIAFLEEKTIRKFVFFCQEIPVVNADRENLEDALQMLIENPRLRKKIGQKSRDYVEKYHDPLKIAKQMREVYLN